MTGIALDGADPDVFLRGVAVLERFNASAPRLLTQFGVAIAVLLHREAPAAPAQGPDRMLKRARLGHAVSTGDLQVHICDVTWEKDSAVLPSGASGPIYKPFTENFKGRSPGVNNWRNSFDLQAGLGCDAPTQLLTDAAYLAQPRFDCRYRDPTTGECSSPAGNVHAANRICFNPKKRDVPPGPATRAQHRPKLLARGVDSSGVQGYWAVEPTVDVLSDLLADPAKRVPVYAFAAALYGSSPYFSQWSTEVSRERLERDLAIGPAEFMAIFDVDPDARRNAEMLRGFTRLQVHVPARVEVPDGATTEPEEVDQGEVEEGRDEGLAAGGTGADTASYSTSPLSEPVPYQERGSDELATEASKQADPARRRRSWSAPTKAIGGRLLRSWLSSSRPATTWTSSSTATTYAGAGKSIWPTCSRSRPGRRRIWPVRFGRAGPSCTSIGTGTVIGSPPTCSSTLFSTASRRSTSGRGSTSRRKRTF